MSLEAAVQNLADAIRYAADKAAHPLMVLPGAVTEVVSDKPAPVKAATSPPKTVLLAKAPPAPAAAPTAPAAATNGTTSPLRKTAKDLVTKVAASKGREVAVALIEGVQPGAGNVTGLAEANLQTFVAAATEALAS